MTRIAMFAAMIGFMLMTGGCDPSTGPYASSVAVTADASELTVLNGTDSDIHVQLIESSIVPLIDWIPVSTDKNRVRPGETYRQPLTDSSYIPSRSVHVYWWHSVMRWSDSTTTFPDSIRCIIVTLPQL